MIEQSNYETAHVPTFCNFCGCKSTPSFVFRPPFHATSLLQNDSFSHHYNLGRLCESVKGHILILPVSLFNFTLSIDFLGAY